ncbi:MAG: sugar phosphate isomerase/epimerase [Bryobacterales bacterium]|nr:sugar phosphate isomerase/epimerase [Bryobacterales bacterium]
MTRRDILAVAGSAPAWLSATASSINAQIKGRPRMGGAPTAFSNNSRLAGGGRGAGGMGAAGGARRGAGQAPGGGTGQPPARRGPGQGGFDIIEKCRQMGMGGVQTNPPSTDPAEIKKFRARLESLDMHLICDPRLPKDASGLAEFEAQVVAYKEAGARSFHAAITGRRYEEYDSIEPWKAEFDRIKKQSQLVEPILAKHRIALGYENHKGYRAAEQAAWMKSMSSEWIGVCLDFGNNMSLCEDPMETARILAPYTVSAHIKDMAVEMYEDGFLLSEVTMGTGMVDLKAIVNLLRQKDPNMIINLEMITRDPLKIPIFTKKYWATFDDAISPLPGRDMSHMLELVRKNPPKQPLPKTSGLSVEEAAKLEDKYNLACVEYGRKYLNL